MEWSPHRGRWTGRRVRGPSSIHQMKMIVNIV